MTAKEPHHLTDKLLLSMMNEMVVKGADLVEEDALDKEEDLEEGGDTAVADDMVGEVEADQHSSHNMNGIKCLPGNDAKSIWKEMAARIRAKLNPILTRTYRNKSLQLQPN
jgi:hypothetical protein